MINGDVSEFVSQLYYEDHDVIYNHKRYFINGCQCDLDKQGKVISATLEVYDESNQTIFTITSETTSECVDAFINAQIWNGKSFYDVEKEIEWVD